MTGFCGACGSRSDRLGLGALHVEIKIAARHQPEGDNQVFVIDIRVEAPAGRIGNEFGQPDWVGR